MRNGLKELQDSKPKIIWDKYKAIFIMVMISSALFILAGFLIEDLWQKVDAFSHARTVHFSLISINSIFAGFLFTSLGILFTLNEKESIRRLGEYGYWDCVIKSIMSGIVFHVISILSALVNVFQIFSWNYFTRGISIIEVFGMYTGIALFLVSINELRLMIKLYRKS